ncbi:MAG TPA: glycoside hydrolase family 16 protein [Anaeromyxobacter sp.]|nr:glycoside hydrolase family 16 protein [Anaeromyxobacter sp.]
MANRISRGAALAAAAGALAIACGLEPPPKEQSTPPPAQGVDPTKRTLPPPNYVLVWQDDFDGSALDGSRWAAQSGSRLDAVNTPSAVAVRNGELVVTTFTQAGTHYTGFVSTNGRFQAQYGYFEARIRFQDAPGSWCAFWLTADTVGKPLGDPADAGVEIDVVEHRATDQGGWDALRDMVALNLNWDGYDEHKKNLQKVTALPDGAPIQGQWHTYGVMWTETGYAFYVDGMQLWTQDSPVAKRPEYMNLTCEVDDASWAGYVPKGGYGSLDTSSAHMEVDWVRAWQPR